MSAAEIAAAEMVGFSVAAVAAAEAAVPVGTERIAAPRHMECHQPAVVLGNILPDAARQGVAACTVASTRRDSSLTGQLLVAVVAAAGARAFASEPAFASASASGGGPASGP